MKRTRAILVGGVALSLGLITVGCDRSEAMNRAAPDFTLKDMEGKSVSLSDFKGRPVLLNFWALG